MSSKVKTKVEYGYFIDADGLYYVSTKSGNPYESFDINGVVSINEYPDYDILYLCYINHDNENTES